MKSYAHACPNPRLALRRALTALVIATLFTLAAAHAGPDDLKVAKALSTTFADIAEKAGPAVVHVKAVHTVEQEAKALGIPKGQEEFFRRFFGPNMPQSPRTPQTPRRKYKIPSQGSGFIFDAKGLVLTNNHVIEKAKEITVTLPDKRTFDAKVVGRDPKSDLAVLRIKKPEGTLPMIPLGDSDKLRVGEIVMAIGAPFGLAKTVTTGIVSAKGRVVGLAHYEDFIQTDAAINPGNSGGPLINLDGQVIGINTAISSRGPVAQSAGVGFAIPTSMAKRIVSQLIQHGEVVRGWIGVGIDDMDQEMAEHFPGYSGKGGVLVTQVGPTMPADKAGIKAGDIITHFGDTVIEDTQHLRHMVANAPVNQESPIRVLRKGKPLTLKITPAKQPRKLSLQQQGEGLDQPEEMEIETSQEMSREFGFDVEELSPEMAKKYGYRNVTGVIITATDPNGPAAEKGLRPGMVVVEIGQETVKDIGSFMDLMRRHRGQKKILFRILAGTNARYIVLQRKEKNDE
ncbi:MAG: Do family serine endopeptidase [Planctomycetota bacterium]|jgi:serine protease Do